MDGMIFTVHLYSSTEDQYLELDEKELNTLSCWLWYPGPIRTSNNLVQEARADLMLLGLLLKNSACFLSEAFSLECRGGSMELLVEAFHFMVF